MGGHGGPPERGDGAEHSRTFAKISGSSHQTEGLVGTSLADLPTRNPGKQSDHSGEGLIDFNMVIADQQFMQAFIVITATALQHGDRAADLGIDLDIAQQHNRIDDIGKPTAGDCQFGAEDLWDFTSHDQGDCAFTQVTNQRSQKIIEAFGIAGCVFKFGDAIDRDPANVPGFGGCTNLSSSEIQIQFNAWILLCTYLSA